MRADSRARALAAVAAMALFGGCGGGNVDPEFTGPIQTMPDHAPGEPSASRAADRGPPRAFSRPKLVEIRADWCRFCRAAQPSIDTAYDAYQTKVDLVVLDVTDDNAAHDSERVAAQEGVSRFFAEYRGRTPTVAVFVGPDQGRLVHGTLDDPETLTRELAFAVAHFDESR